MRKTFRIIIPLLIIAILASSWSSFWLYQKYSTNLSIPLAMAYDLNQTVTSGQPLTISFPEEMNQKSVEESLIIPPEISGTLSWTDSKNITLTPKKPTQVGDTFIIVLQKNTKKKDNSYIPNDLEFHFNIANAPSVINSIPNNKAENIPITSQIAITFDRPMIPLSSLQGENSIYQPKNWEINLTPNQAGKWRWLGTSTISFFPEEKELLPATQYHIQIPAGVEILNGEKIEEDFNLNFETIRPQIISTIPRAGANDFNPNEPLLLDFNQNVDPREILSKAKLIETESQKQINWQKAEYKKIKNEDSDKEEEEEIIQNKILLYPQSKLTFDTNYTFTLKQDTKALLGDLGFAEDYSFAFKTAGDLTIASCEYEYDSLHVSFSKSNSLIL